MGSQSVAKTVFLLVSMVGWLIVGAALMYLFPLVADQIVSSDLTHTWMRTLGQGGYNPKLAYVGGGTILLLTALGHFVWYQWFEGEQ
ncbi:MAG: hypothetical protein HC881_02630 [Leptolyngbyaceae cyanobacterium SL_7_1]|nr:hypothetical protein [Leptolyngbyaceae cyanobacterium SL_7_1]